MRRNSAMFQTFHRSGRSLSGWRFQGGSGTHRQDGGKTSHFTLAGEQAASFNLDLMKSAANKGTSGTLVTDQLRDTVAGVVAAPPKPPPNPKYAHRYLNPDDLKLDLVGDLPPPPAKSEAPKGDGGEKDEKGDPSAATTLVDKLRDLKLQGYWSAALKLWEKNVQLSSTKQAWEWKAFHYQLLHDLLTEAGKFDEVRRVWEYMLTRKVVPVDQLSANGLVKQLSKSRSVATQSIRLQLLEEVLAYMAQAGLDLNVVGLQAVQAAHARSPGSWDKALASLVDVAVMSNLKWDTFEGLSIDKINNLVISQLPTEHDVVCTLAYLTAKQQCAKFPKELSGVFGNSSPPLGETAFTESEELVTILPNETSYAWRLDKMDSKRWLEALEAFDRVRLMRTAGGMYPPGAMVEETQEPTEEGAPPEVKNVPQLQPDPANHPHIVFNKTMKILRYSHKFHQHLAFRVFELMIGKEWEKKPLTVRQRHLLNHNRKIKAQAKAEMTSTQVSKLNDILGLETAPASSSPSESTPEEENVPEEPIPVVDKNDRGVATDKEDDGFDPTSTTGYDDDPPGTLRAYPDSATLDTLVGIYDYQGRWQEVLRTIQIFKKEYPKAEGTNTTFSAQVKAMSKSGSNPDSANQLLSVFEDMTKKGYKGTTQSDIAAIDAWSKVKRRRY